MQPLHPRKRSRSIQSAQVMLRDGLDWLRGYPVGEPEPGGSLRWVIVPEPGRGAPRVITISREVLRASFAAREKLYRKFPVVLPRIVGNTEAWYRRIGWRLEAIQGAVHDGLRLPDVETLLERARVSDRDRKRMGHLARAVDLRPLLRAVLWLEATDAGPLEGLLELGAHRGLGVLAARLSSEGAAGLVPLIRLLQLVSLDGEQRVEGILRVLSHPSSFGVPLAALSAGGSSPAARRIEVVKPSPDALRYWPHRPGPGDSEARRLGPAFLAALESLAALGETARRTALRLLDIAAPWNVLAAWDRWWREVARVQPERDRFHGLGRQLRPRDRERLAALVAHLAELLGEMPPEVDAAALVRASLGATFADDPRLAGVVARVLELLPEESGGRLPRASFLVSWSAWPRGKLHVLGRLARALELHLAWDASPVALAPWRDLFERAGAASRDESACPDDLFLRGDLSSELVGPLFETLHLGLARTSFARALETPDQRPLVLEVLGRLVTALGDPSRAVEHMDAILGKRGGVKEAATPLYLASSDSAERLAGYLDHLAGGDSRVFGDLLERSRRYLHGADEARYLLATESLRKPAEIRQAILAGGIRRVQRLGLRLAALASCGGNTARETARAFRPVRPADASWIERYPAALREHLCGLARVDGKAAAAALRIFAAHFPAARAMEREIEALEREMPAAPAARAAHMGRRLETLRHRLSEAHGGAPAAGLGKVAARIDRRAAMETLRRAEKRIDAAIRVRVLDRTGLELPAVWRDSRRLDALCHLVLLPAASKDLALRLLRARAGPRPWDLREAPANRAFLERLGAAGLDPRPWLEGLPPRKATLEDGREVLLALEDDPLEVLLMGEPFRTCLAPGANNFFSAVSNAADINKRVLHGRAQDGRILGRCLLALTDRFRLLTFELYTSVPGFKGPAAAFARDLAAAMGTETEPAGTVSILEAPDWYDDGATDLTGRLAFAGDGSELRGALSRIAPEDLDRSLEEAGIGRSLHPFALPILLGLPEVLARPDLVEALLARTRLLRRLPPETAPWLACAGGLRAAGHSGAAAELVRRMATTHARSGPRACPHCTQWILEELLALGEPGEALRLLVATRPRGVRRPEDETGERARLAATALAALHREGAAARLAERGAHASF